MKDAQYRFDLIRGVFEARLRAAREELSALSKKREAAQVYVHNAEADLSRFDDFIAETNADVYIVSKPDRATTRTPTMAQRESLALRNCCPRCGSTSYTDSSQSYDCNQCGKSW